MDSAQVQYDRLKLRLQNHTLEKQMIGHILNKGEDQIEAILGLKPEHFSHPECKELYKVIQTMFLNKQNVSPISVSSFIDVSVTQSNLKAVRECYNEVAREALTDTVGNSIILLKEYLKNRKIYYEILVKANQDFIEGKSPNEIIQHIGKVITEAESAAEDEKSTEEIASNVIDSILNGSDFDKGLDTGLYEFDMQFGGIKKDRVYCIGAQSGAGKTAILVDFIERLSTRHKKKVRILFFSMEMSEDRIVRRMISRITGLTNQQLEGRIRPLTDQEKAMVKAAGELIKTYPIEIVYKTISVSQMKLRAKKFVLENPDCHHIFMIDHLGLFTAETSDMRVETIKASSACKSLAVDYHGSVIELTQFTKESESESAKRNYYRPQLGWIMESGRVRQDADVVLLYWRPEMYFDKIPYAGDEEWKTDGNIIALVEKNRDGHAPSDIIFKQNIGANIILNSQDVF